MPDKAGELLRIRRFLKTKGKAAARKVERIEGGMRFMANSLLCARGLRQRNEIKDEHAAFHVRKKRLRKTKASPAARKGMRTANPWLDLRAKHSIDSRPEFPDDINLL
jgi:hypothetical protein